MRNLFLFALILALGLVFGCSSGSETPVTADEPVAGATASNHNLWGVWQFQADPDAQTLEITPLRASEFHLNALPFLEPPPLVNLTLESVKFNGNVVEADIGLRHPFLGLNEFTGFDVCGILFTNGSVTGFDDPDLRMAGEGDTRLLNPDGFSRWWNPTEFPVNLGTMFSYNDGLLGTADAVGHYNSTLNAYKYFCNDLQPNDPISDITLTHRGLFSAGSKNIRHYSIELGGGLIFNYAVDACWQFPTGGKPWDVPGDFPQGANRAEAWRLNITETENTLWNDGVGSGGDLKLAVDVYDWFDAESNSVKVESPGNFAAVVSSTPSGTGDGYATYDIDITGATPGEGEIELLISAISGEDGFEGFIPGTNTTAYFMYTSKVSSEPPITAPGWVQTWGGPGGWDQGWDITLDDSGNIYVSGMFSSTVDFDPGDGTYFRTASGSFDAYVSKFDQDGNFIWARTWGGTNEDWAKSVTVSGDYLYVSGYFRTLTASEQVDFDPDPNKTTYKASNGDRDGFISQFNLDGTFNWVQTWGTANYEWGGEDLVCDSSANVYSLGWNEGLWRIDLRSYTSTGTLQWSYIWPSGASIVRMEDITLYGSNLYFTGLISGSNMDMDPGPGTTQISVASEGILCCFSTSGGFQWVKHWGAGGEMWTQSVACDPSSNIYIGGTFTGVDIDFDPGPDTELHSSVDGASNRDCFLTKFDSSGNHEWAKTWGGSGNEDWTKGVACDSSGNPYVVGYYRSNSCNLDPDGSDPRANAGGIDIFLSRFDPTGDYVWGRNIGGTSYDIGADLVIDGPGIFYTGYFSSYNMDFDPGPGVENRSTHGSEDVFLSRISTDGNW